MRALLAALALAVLVTACGEAPAVSEGPQLSAHEQRRLDIRTRLQADPGETEEGIALAVLVDVSGSMAQQVATADGKERKIVVAQRATQQLLARIDAFAREHPDQRVVCGVWEFSTRPRQPSSREVVPLGPVDLEADSRKVLRMQADGGTPIGDAMIEAKRQLDRSGMSKRHMLVVTDGENTDGFAPEHVAEILAEGPVEETPSIYFVAFDTAASQFDGVKDEGGLVLSAANGPELDQALDFLLTGKILAEAPSVPSGR